MGDFNKITHESEKVGVRCKPMSQMVEFISTLEKCHLKDLSFVGPKFTWWNMQDGVHFIKERLIGPGRGQLWLVGAFPHQVSGGSGLEEFGPCTVVAAFSKL